MNDEFFHPEEQRSWFVIRHSDFVVAAQPPLFLYKGLFFDADHALARREG